MKRLRGMPCSQSMNGEPFRVSGSGGIIVASRASVPVNPSVSRGRSAKNPLVRPFFDAHTAASDPIAPFSNHCQQLVLRPT